MAARRLLIVLLLLLGISTLAAALLPDRAGERENGTEEETATRPSTAPTERTSPGGERGVGVRIQPGRVRVIRAEVGEQLTIRVRADRAGLLEIPALGLVDAVAPGAPARFNLLPTEPASYGIRFLDSERVVARIEVEG